MRHKSYIQTFHALVETRELSKILSNKDSDICLNLYLEISAYCGDIFLPKFTLRTRITYYLTFYLPCQVSLNAR